MGKSQFPVVFSHELAKIDRNWGNPMVSLLNPVSLIAIGTGLGSRFGGKSSKCSISELRRSCASNRGMGSARKHRESDSDAFLDV